MTETISNISCYLFAQLTDLRSMRDRLLTHCKAVNLKGTILLSHEGINMFLAGRRQDIDAVVAELRKVPGLEKLAPKYSDNTYQPFSRMLVRIKKEIIAFGVPGIDPSARTSPKLKAAELKRWLDEGRPLTLLDTRNDYEVKLGTFKNAHIMPLKTFREFPKAVSELPGELKDQPIVMFCTGGIRCEKAGPYMESQGFNNIWQLDGGILKYFEEVGGDHYDGECFVFDQRVGLDPGLHETDSNQCFACLAPLSAEDQADPRYVPGKTCPHCHKTPAEEMAVAMKRREEALAKATTPLPGLVPEDNRRPLTVGMEFDGVTVLEFLSQALPHVTSEEWQQLIGSGEVENDRQQALTATDTVKAGQRLYQLRPGQIEPAVATDIKLLYEDEAIIVLNKPAPLPIHPCGRYNRHTLQSFLNAVYGQHRPRPAHRLDANTTGVVVLSRTRHVAGRMQPQFERGEVKKFYLARVHGQPEQDQFVCEAPISEKSLEAGTREVDEENGLSAKTEFSVIRRFEDGTSLLECRPLTGRTNQIRLHLWHLGHAIVGDPAYQADGIMGTTQTLPVGAPPMCLHAWKLSFRHPLTQEPLHFTAPEPDWAK